MSVAVRLMRFGKKGYPTYRIVALDKRSKRDGFYLEKIGLYNPMTDDNQLILNEERFSYWISQGAQVSEGIQKLLSKKLEKSKKKVSKPKLTHVQKGLVSKKEEKKEEKAAPVESKAETPAETPVEAAPTEAVATESAPTETPSNKAATPEATEEPKTS